MWLYIRRDRELYGFREYDYLTAYYPGRLEHRWRNSGPDPDRPDLNLISALPLEEARALELIAEFKNRDVYGAWVYSLERVR